MAPLAEASLPTIEPVTIHTHKSIEEPQEPQREALCEEEVANDHDDTNESLLSTEAVVADNNDAEQAVKEDVATAATADAQEPDKKRVRFNVADVVEFEPTMWTATVSSEGVPLGMSVNVRRRTKRALDIYEIERITQRVDRQEYMELGYLEPEERLDILENAGHSISIISHVERDTFRINRERWESNEYDLMYQYGLGEVPLIEDDNQDMQESDDIMHVDYNSEDDFFFGGNGRNMIVDSEAHFTMEDMDAYDAINSQSYDDLSIDYASDCILGDDESSDENNELPYAIDSFDSPHSCDLMEMGTSSFDVSSSSDCMLAAVSASSCGQSVSATSSASSSTESGSPVISVEVASVVAV